MSVVEVDLELVVARGAKHLNITAAGGVMLDAVQRPADPKIVVGKQINVIATGWAIAIQTDRPCGRDVGHA